MENDRIASTSTFRMLSGRLRLARQRKNTAQNDSQTSGRLIDSPSLMPRASGQATSGPTSASITKPDGSTLPPAIWPASP